MTKVKGSISNAIAREIRQKKESLTSVNGDLEPCEDGKENSSKHRGNPVLTEQSEAKSPARKKKGRSTALSPLQNINNGVVSTEILLSPSHTVDHNKAGVLLESQEEFTSFLDKRFSRSSTLEFPTEDSKQIADGVALEAEKTEATEKFDDDEKHKREENTFQMGISGLRRSNRQKRKPIRFDLEYAGLGSLPISKALVKPSYTENIKQDPTTSVHELELLLKINSSPLPFCDPFSSIYSFGSIGRKKLDSLNPDPRGSGVLLSDIFAPEGVFSSVDLPGKIDLNTGEEAKPKPLDKSELSEFMYEGRKIAEMTQPEYSCMLRKIAQDSKAPDRAHNILRDTIQQYRDCVGTLRPNGACFNVVIHGYAQLGYAAAAENVLSLMFQEYINSDNDLAEPNVRVYTNVLHAWRKSNSIDAHERCERILEEMQRLSETGIAPRCRPDTFSYTVLFHSLAESDCPDAFQIAERQLKKVKEGSMNISLDAIAYSSLMNIFTKNPATHERAEEILWEMVSDHKGGNKKAKPHTRNFNTILAMWAKSNHPDSALRAQGVIERLILIEDEGIFHVRPDEFSYSLLLKCWVSRGRIGIEHAVNCLNWMEERHRRGDKAAKLDTIKYTTCISALAREGLSHQAEVLLKKMECDHRNGNKLARPDAKNFETVISSWSGFYGANHVIDETRAENLLHTMWALGQQPGFAHIRPGMLTYIRVVEAMARKRKPKRSETLLDEMISLNKTGRLPTGPDMHTYRVVIDAWMNSDFKDRDVRAGQLRSRMNRQFGIGN